MKKLRIALMMGLLAAVAATLISSCKKDSNSGGTPRIDYVRITAPESSDSLLAGAYQGQLIAIVGDNLGGAQQIWFNDRPSVVIPTYNTNTTILVSVPSDVPVEITNMVKIIFASGKTLEYPFKVEISEPLITAMECEYVPEGGTATIYGNYFYQPLTVTFTGGATGDVASINEDGTIMQVKVPAGVKPGPITIVTNFGEKESDFWFNDNRNIFVSSDPYSGWWNESFVVTNPAAADPPKINGNYIRVTKGIGGWSWMEVAGGPPDAMGSISKNIPDDAILHPEKYNMKFEVNTLKPFDNNVIKINAGIPDFNNDAYQWLPPYDTKGQWKTVVIPFDEMAAAYKAAGTTLSVQPNGYYTRIWFHGPGDLDCDMCFDNFRIVPKLGK